MGERRAIKSLVRLGDSRKGAAPMTGWTTEELTGIEGADELEIASLRSDGMLGSSRTIWVV